jgi:hypothetical protein
MCPIVYISRPSSQTIARSVCLQEDSGLVLSLDNTLPPGKVESTTKVSPLQLEEKLSYDRVLIVLLKADKVITL